MSAVIGAGWSIHHLTDRCIELRKDDYSYRRFLGRPGYVLIRGEPGMDRQTMLNRAIEAAKRNDAELGLMIGKRLAPSLAQLAAYQNKQVQWAPVWGTPEDEKYTGRKRA